LEVFFFSLSGTHEVICMTPWKTVMVQAEAFDTKGVIRGCNREVVVFVDFGRRSLSTHDAKMRAPEDDVTKIITGLRGSSGAKDYNILKRLWQ
jgi:hypothetical protein